MPAKISEKDRKNANQKYPKRITKMPLMCPQNASKNVRKNAWNAY
jgi:hypothetical protein